MESTYLENETFTDKVQTLFCLFCGEFNGVLHLLFKKALIFQIFGERKRQSGVWHSPTKIMYSFYEGIHSTSETKIIETEARETDKFANGIPPNPKSKRSPFNISTRADRT